MKNVSIVTDGSCDLPIDLVEKYNIHITPFRVIFGENVYNLYGDSGDITKEEFYNRLKTSDVMPSTGVPPPKVFKDTFDIALADAKSVIALFISKELSGTYQSALRITEMFDGQDITLVDTKTAAIAAGLLVLHVAKMANNGASKDDILNELDRLIPQTRLAVVMDTLEYLHRGGRIGGAKKFFGQSFKIKPILHIEDGKVIAGGTIRGRAEVIKRMKFMAPFVVKNAITDNVFIWHTRDLETAKELLEIMEEVNDNGLEIRIQEAGPVIGTHTGPLAIGFAYLGKYNKNWLTKMKE